MQRNILKIVGAIIVGFGFSGVALADAVMETRQALELWEPISVEKKRSSLIVIAKERRMTTKIYNAMISRICVWVGAEGAKLQGVKEIAILNRFGASGMVFEASSKACERIFRAPGSELYIIIAGQTHMYSCTSGRSCQY
jgi:hypothetical protein